MRISDWSSDVCSSDLADLALYAAKGSGRGRFRFYSSDLHQAAEDRRVLEEDLRDALARGQMELNYQPVVNAKTNMVTGVEALIRSEEHTSELQSLMRISYAVFCLKKKIKALVS